MADSRQLDILKRLGAHLEGITPANGYDFDMTGRVFRGRAWYGDDDPLPMIALLEYLSPDINLQMAGVNNTNREETWILLVQGFVQQQPENPTDDAYQLKAAVEKRLAETIATGRYDDPLVPAAYKLGLHTKGIVNISIGPGIVSVPRESQVSAYAFFYLPVGIERAVDVTDPFVS
jgi:hypothetical protein